MHNAVTTKVSANNLDNDIENQGVNLNEPNETTDGTSNDTGANTENNGI